MTNPTEQKWLLCRVGTLRCAIPLACVTETMRTSNLMPVDDAEGLVAGAAMIHGDLVPVVDTGALLGEPQTDPRRLVTISVGDRSVAIAVDEVTGCRARRSAWARRSVFSRSGKSGRRLAR